MGLNGNELSPADIMALSGNNNNGWNNGMCGMEWFWIIFIFMFCGWGGMGFGGGWGVNGMNGGVGAEIQRGFDQNNIIRKLDEQTYGIADATFALNNTIQQGFSTAELSRCNQQAALMAQLCNMASQSQQCCCETQRLIERTAADSNYNMATQFCETRHQASDNTRDIVESNNAGTRAILDKLAQMEYNSLNDKYQATLNENNILRGQLSQHDQNAYLTATIDAAQATLIRRLGADCPTPAYVVQPPTTVTFPTNGCGLATFNSGCGCRTCS